MEGVVHYMSFHHRYVKISNCGAAQIQTDDSDCEHEVTVVELYSCWSRLEGIGSYRFPGYACLVYC